MKKFYNSHKHKQFQIDTSDTINYSDKIKGVSKVLVLICTKNGAISIIDRDLKEETINTEYPLVEIAGDHHTQENCLLEDQIELLEYHNVLGKQAFVSISYVFLSKKF